MKLQNHAYPRRFAVLGAVFAAALFGSVLLGRFSVTPIRFSIWIPIASKN